MAFRFRLLFPGGDAKRRNVAVEEPPTKAAPDAGSGDSPLPDGVPPSVPNADQGASEAVSLEEFLAKNFLYEEPPVQAATEEEAPSDWSLDETPNVGDLRTEEPVDAVALPEPMAEPEIEEANEPGVEAAAELELMAAELEIEEAEAVEQNDESRQTEAALREATQAYLDRELQGEPLSTSEAEVRVASAEEVTSPIEEVPTPTEGVSTTAEVAPTAAEEPPVISMSNPPDSPLDVLPVAPSNWAFEERLASHKEWVESQGVTGKRADFSCAELEGAELIGVNLRYADLHAANLKAVDLLLTDLRDACLVRANLQEACLVGANLEGANLEGASMETAMGLVPRQLAGATLRDASLPAQILQFDARGEFERASRTALRYFTTMISVSLVIWLVVWKTRDIQLLTDSAVIPYLHSPAAADAMPTDEIYLIAPVLLFILYLVFQFNLQRLWDAVLELPAVFPDGHTLGEKEPRIVKGLLRAHFRWLNQDAPSTRVIERAVSVFLAYWIVPATLVLIWARYLTLQEMHGTILQELLAAISVGVAAYATTKIGRPQERWVLGGRSAGKIVGKIRKVSPISLAIGVCVFLTLLSAGAIKGIPHDRGRAPQFKAADIRRWGPSVFWFIGFDPYADLTEAQISTKPDNWNGADDQVSSVTGANLNNRNVRYAQAYGVFLANAHLWRADFQGSFMSEADLRSADLGQSSLKYVVLDRAQMNHANLDRADLEGANLSRVDLRDANLSYTSMQGAILVDARLDGASLYGARLDSATMIRTNVEKADLRNSYLGDANLDHADMQQAYLWSAQLPGAHMENAKLETAIFIDANLHGADLHGAEFAGTVLNGADLSGTNLVGADLRGSLGLTANQVCSSVARQGALLDAALEAQVDTQCGGLH
jgi:uncharacterized protein YjbI with pentapeptide repeats